MSTILFSPVRCDYEILKQTAPSWFGLRGVDEFWCYDDNTDPQSSELLRSLRFRILPKLDTVVPGQYSTSELTHHWDFRSVRRVAQIKNYAIQEFLKSKRAFLVLIDADLCPHPSTVEALHAVSGPIVSEIFWTRWVPQAPELPNCWDVQPNWYFSLDSLVRLRESGVYGVGGLGALTLLHRAVLEHLDFSLPSLPPEWGEDRAFCLKALAFGLPLLVDTHYPAFHAYRHSLLPSLEEWKRAGSAPDWFRKKWLGDSWLDSVRNFFNERTNAAAA